MGVTAHAYLSIVLWYLGYPDQALKRNNEARELASKLSFPFSLAFAHCHAAMLHSYRREAPVGQAQAETAIELSREHGFPSWLTYGTMMRGWALVEHGKLEEGVSRIREALTSWQRPGVQLAQSLFLGVLAKGKAGVGDVEEAQSILTDTFAYVAKSHEEFFAPELHRLMGEVSLQQSPNNALDAEFSFQKALEVSRRQEAKSLELRAAMSLARLWHQQGKSNEAHQLLAPIYDWFTEGFDTPDLKDAKVLLAELA